jgi:hypothetical protein
MILLLSNSQMTSASCEDLLEYRSALCTPLCGRPMARRIFCALRPNRLARSVKLLNTNHARAPDGARYAAPPNKGEVHAHSRRRRGRWTPPGYLRVCDLAGAPLSRASLYREISSGNLSAVRSRAGILVREDDYARWLADATALHTTDVADAAEEVCDE